MCQGASLAQKIRSYFYPQGWLHLKSSVQTKIFLIQNTWNCSCLNLCVVSWIMGNRALRQVKWLSFNGVISTCTSCNTASDCPAIGNIEVTRSTSSISRRDAESSLPQIEVSVDQKVLTSVRLLNAIDWVVNGCRIWNGQHRECITGGCVSSDIPHSYLKFMFSLSWRNGKGGGLRNVISDIIDTRNCLVSPSTFIEVLFLTFACRIASELNCDPSNKSYICPVRSVIRYLIENSCSVSLTVSLLMPKSPSTKPRHRQVH